MISTLTALLLVTASTLSTPAPDRVVAAKPPVVVIHAKEFSFRTPKRIAAGMTTFRLVNQGREVHHLSIIHLAAGKTLADYMAAIKASGPPPAWATDVGGPNPATPGGSASATLALEAGNYLIACWIPSPGNPTPHAMKGMIQAMTVEPSKSAAVSAATPDIHLELSDYGFKFSKSLTVGHHVVHVMNAGPQAHEVVMVQLAPGKSMKDFGAWAQSMKGPPPGKMLDGLTGLSVGRTAQFEMNVKPGTYGMICFVPDSKDGKPHVDHGMVTEVVVAK